MPPYTRSRREPIIGTTPFLPFVPIPLVSIGALSAVKHRSVLYFATVETPGISGKRIENGRNVLRTAKDSPVPKRIVRARRIYFRGVLVQRAN